MNALGRVFERLGVKVHNAARLSFLGDRLPDDGELNRVISEHRLRFHDDLMAAMEKAKPGPRLNIITTSSMDGEKADAPAVHAFDEPEPRPEPDAGGLRALWRKLKAELNENEQK